MCKPALNYCLLIRRRDSCKLVVEVFLGLYEYFYEGFNGIQDVLSSLLISSRCLNSEGDEQ